MLGNMFGFQGRIGRGTWWLGQLLGFLVIIAGIVVAGMMAPGEGSEDFSGGFIFPLAVAYILGLIINISTSVKRYHDRGKSGWWFFIVFVPLIGGIWQFIELGFCRGTEGDNHYGPDPASGTSSDMGRGGAGEMSSASGGKFAKLDDEYFRNYAAQSQKAAAAPSVQSTYARPEASITPVNSLGARPAFGKR